MKRTRKVGRPRKISYKPAITIVYDENVMQTLLEMKYKLGMPLTIGELSEMLTNMTMPYGVEIKIEVKKKEAWYKRVLNWFKSKMK